MIEQHSGLDLDLQAAGGSQGRLNTLLQKLKYYERRLVWCIGSSYELLEERDPRPTFVLLLTFIGGQMTSVCVVRLPADRCQDLVDSAQYSTV